VKSLLERARAALPGGVNSPVRAFAAVEGDPPFVARGEGPWIFDTDGRRYVDLVGSWGPLVLGHAHPAVLEAVLRAARDGLSFGATCAAEVELAEAILARYPFADKVRFVSTGTEAVMSAVRLARGFTGRERIVKFEGCYHGHADSLLVQAGSGLATLGNGAQPSSAGVPAALAALTEVLPLDDEGALRELFSRKGSEIAGLIVEPVPANSGLLVQRPEFLRALREVTREHGALLIFDEVISGLRVAPGGACERYGIEPDLVTLGKIIGGGMPVGAYLGRGEIMRRVAPLGPVYQAGTLSGNPLAMAAGLATLKELARPGAYERLEALGSRLETGWKRALAASGVGGSVARVGSILWSCGQASPPRAWHRVDKAFAASYARLHPRLLSRGCWMAPSAWEVAFVSTAHDEASVDLALNAFEGAWKDLGRGS
jgi:glutamate-1-semialdehyde 2,1-aminomutase